MKIRFMKSLRVFLLVTTLSFTLSSTAQKMDNNTLEKIIYVVSDTIQGDLGNWQFMIDGKMFLCITDENHDRMRIMTPITSQEDLTTKDMQTLLEANFHTALDVKYALSNKLLWSVFIHPLKQLNKDQIIDAINQVYAAALTYGTTYNSTGLVFPDGKEESQKGVISN